MKFGKELERLALPKWSKDYIQYKELKKAVKVFTGQDKDHATVQEVTHWTSSFLRLGPNPEKTPEARLLDVIMGELDRISKFTKLEEESVRTQLERLEQQSRNEDADKESLMASLDDLGEQIVHLKTFAQLNFRGFRKILKKYDKWSRSSVMPWVMGKVTNSPFMQVDYDGLLMIFNRVASNIYKRGGPANGKKDASSQGQIYFVDTKDSMRVKVQLAKQLGLSFVGDNAKSARSSCTYYDTPKLSVYSAYQESTAACEAVHIKSVEGSSDVCVVIEKPGEERQEAFLARVEASKVLGVGAALSKNEVIAAAQASIQNGQTPIAQGTYMRSVFHDQASGITAVLDEDVRMSRVQEWDGPTTGSEFFPYSLLSVHFEPGKSTKEAPKWLTHIYDCANLFQVSGFSKAAHMVGNYRAKECSLPLPHWQSRIANCADQSHEPAEIQSEKISPNFSKVQPKEDGPVQPIPRTRERAASRALLFSFDTSPEEKDMIDISDGAAADIVTHPGAEGGLTAPLLAHGGSSEVDSTLQQKAWFPFTMQGKSTGAKAVRRAIVAVQPKTLNSLERTFLEWIHFVTLVATVGVFMMHAGGEEAIGRFLVLAAVLLVIRVHSVFTWRAEALDLKRDMEYHDPVTPVVLVASLIVGVLWASFRAVGIVEVN